MKQHSGRRGIVASVGAFVVAAALAFSGAAAAQAAPTIPRGTQKGNLHITKLSTPTGDPDDANGAQVTSQDWPAGSAAIPGVTFTVQKVQGIDLSTNAGWQAAQKATLSYGAGGTNPQVLEQPGGSALGLQTPGATGTTDNTGVPKNGGSDAFQNMDIGLYLVTETGTPAGVTPAVPFLVTLPMTDPTNQSAWVYDVYVYPKNAKINAPVKTVADSSVRQTGTNFEWTIESGVPRLPGATAGAWLAPTSYVIEDTLSTHLNYVSTVVKIGSTTLVAGQNATTGDYHVTGTATVVFNADGLAKLQAAATNAANTVSVTHTTSAKPSAAGEVVTNTATVKVNNEATGLTSTPVAVRYGALSFNKQTPNGAALTGAKFKVFTTKSDAEAGSGTGLIGEQTSAGANATVSFSGLRASNFANGALITSKADWTVYWVTETAAPTGYELLAQPIPVVVEVDENGASAVTQVQVDANGKPAIDGNGAFVNATALTKIVNVEKNAGFALPLTGGMGTAFLTIGGIAILAIVLVVARRRRSEEATQ
ncbi:SpaH/EbpB family LPXTG-anchored major pilin [Leucobacter sp. HY1908]